MMQSIRFLLCVLAVGLCLAHGEPAMAGDPTAAAPAAAAPRGILPLPDYSGDLFDRSHLLGDPGGLRSELARFGVTLEIDFNQYFQSVVDGGIRTGSRYGATIDYGSRVEKDRVDPQVVFQRSATLYFQPGPRLHLGSVLA